MTCRYFLSFWSNTVWIDNVLVMINAHNPGSKLWGNFGITSTTPILLKNEILHWWKETSWQLFRRLKLLDDDATTFIFPPVVSDTLCNFIAKFLLPFFPPLFFPFFFFLLPLDTEPHIKLPQLAQHHDCWQYQDQWWQCTCFLFGGTSALYSISTSGSRFLTWGKCIPCTVHDCSPEQHPG